MPSRLHHVLDAPPPNTALIPQPSYSSTASFDLGRIEPDITSSSSISSDRSQASAELEPRAFRRQAPPAHPSVQDLKSMSAIFGFVGPVRANVHQYVLNTLSPAKRLTTEM